MPIEPVQIDTLTERIIGCGMAVHSAHGPGLLESIYHKSMFLELKLAGLRVDRKRRLSVKYRGHSVGTPEVDLVIEDLVVVEIKAVESLHPVHSAQVISYLKLTGCPAGLLMNFNATSLRAGLKRLDHPDLYQKKQAPRRVEGNSAEESNAKNV